MYDEWDEPLTMIEKIYGSELAEKLSNMIDEGRIPLVNYLLRLFL